MLNFNDLLREFLALREWDDEIRYNADTDDWYINTNVGVNNQPIRLIVEGCNETQILGIYFYFNVSYIENQKHEMIELTNWINIRNLVGHFQILNDGVIRLVQKFDCEGTYLSPQTLSINIQHGWDSMERYANLIIKVALGQSCAREAINYFVENQNSDGKIIH